MLGVPPVALFHTGTPAPHTSMPETWRTAAQTARTHALIRPRTPFGRARNGLRRRRQQQQCGGAAAAATVARRGGAGMTIGRARPRGPHNVNSSGHSRGDGRRQSGRELANWSGPPAGSSLLLYGSRRLYCKKVTKTLIPGVSNTWRGDRLIAKAIVYRIARLTSKHKRRPSMLG